MKLAEVEKVFSTSKDIRGTVYIDKRTGIRFRKLQGGQYPVGVSESEIKQAHQMGFEGEIDGFDPFRGEDFVQVRSLLISESPLTYSHVLQLAQAKPPISKYVDEAGPDDAVSLPFVWVQSHLTSDPFDLPTQVELEAACRGNKKREMFPWGNDMLPKRELKKWMKTSFTKPLLLPANKIGLVGLTNGAWSKTVFDYSKSNIALRPKTKKPVLKQSVKLGAALYWPWQTSEWIYCMNGVHSSEYELWPRPTCAVRLIVRISE